MFCGCVGVFSGRHFGIILGFSWVGGLLWSICFRMRGFFGGGVSEASVFVRSRSDLLTLLRSYGKVEDSTFLAWRAGAEKRRDSGKLPPSS